MPGNQPRMLDKALSLAPDAFIPDLEDSVPAEEKATARKLVASYLPRLSRTGRRVIPRVNSLGTSLLSDDLECVVGLDIFGVSIGKVRSAEDIAEISTTLALLERARGLDVGWVRLVPWIESAEAIVHAHQICAASPRIVAVAFGAEDYTADMGIERTEDGSEIVYARSVVGVAARAAGVAALDTPFFGLRDPDGLRQDANRAKTYGFQGKFAIHPEQIDIINETFSPSPGEIDWARRVVAAFEEAETGGRASTTLDGLVIDIPVVKRARQLLEFACALSQTPPGEE